MLVVILSFNRRQVLERKHVIIDSKKIRVEIIYTDNYYGDDGNHNRSGDEPEASMPQISGLSALNRHLTRLGMNVSKKPSSLVERLKAGKDTDQDADEPDTTPTSLSSENPSPN